MLNMQQLRENWYFVDTMGRGYYPSFADDILQHHGIAGLSEIKMEPEDKDLLYEGQLDFISFSYYRSNITQDGDELV